MTTRNKFHPERRDSKIIAANNFVQLTQPWSLSLARAARMGL
jgi:hypothetical protein